jgi:serine/threonine protein kinase/tetratricopeptide (TPR) repeat protein
VPIKCPKCQFENPDDTLYCGKCATPLRPSEDIPAVTETLETPKDELTTGSIFAERYQIIEELGRGGMGRVYKVLDTTIKEKIALKLLKPEIASDKKTIERFRNELKFARKIRHENVCQMYDLNEEKGAHYITMEFVPGENLKSMIRMSGQLSLGTTIGVAKKVCEGLAAAHKVAVVHRDLKPQNVMIDKEGNARILDFGIARSVEGKGITGAGVMIGTPEYMSPEQVEGKEVDQRSDIYSLGVILYEMVTGRVPFEGDTPFTIGVKHKSEIPKDPREINAQVSEDLSRVIMRCIGKDKKERYQSAGEVLFELTRLEEGIPIPERVEPKRKPATSKEITVTFRKPWIWIAALFVAVIVVGAAILFFRGEKPILSPAKKRLAVLPFKNLGPPEDEYFADSITEEIRARLIQIERLSMIARTSAYQYKNTDKTIKKIGEELGVDYILEGTIRWQRSPDGPSRVRVTPELIRASDSTNLWVEVYDKDITDIFEVQSAIAEQVAEALDITLGEEKRKALKAKPTANIEAYNYYLRGIDYFNRSYDEEDFRIAVQMFERAIGIDPNFALAYTKLTRAYLMWYSIYYFRVDLSLVAKAKEAVDMALKLNPDSPETHWALGYYYYYGHLDYDRALEHFNQAKKGLEDSSDILAGIAFVQRRQGKFDQAADNLMKAAELDPRAQRMLLEIGFTYICLRNYPESERYYNQAISLAPDLVAPYAGKMELYLNWEGSTEKALKVLEGAPQEVRSSEAPHFVLESILVHIFDGKYQKALDRLSLLSSDVLNYHGFFIPKALLYARIYGLLNQPELALEHYDSARSLLEAKVQEWPEDARVHSSLGLAYAGLGRKEEAIQEGKLAVELLPVTKDALRSPDRVEDLARIYVMVGEYDAAIDQLEFLLSIPYEISIPLLKLDPSWAPLRDHPRFQKILKRGKY